MTNKEAVEILNKQGVGLLEAILLFGAVVAIFCVIFQIVGVLMV